MITKSVPIPESELILNPDGSIYHLHLRPEHLANTIITVGDPERVGEISKYFDRIEFKIQNREFVTHTGWIGNKRISVVATGIGTDNIDIVLTELDALVNIDFETRMVKEEPVSLEIIRMGTAGSLQSEIEVDQLVVSSFGIGLDNLMQFYETTFKADELILSDAILEHFEKQSELMVFPYAYQADSSLLQKLGKDIQEGITVTCPGFYGPQGRQLRTNLAEPNLIRILSSFKHGGKRISNFEMETAGIYGMSRALGHRAVSFSAIVANRITQVFSKDPASVVKRMIETLLERISAG